MHKRYTNTLIDTPILLFDDAYLCDDAGNVFAFRAGAEKVKNIFSIVDSEDMACIRENALFYGLKPLLLVNSSLGPIFVDCSLFADYRLFVGIVPYFKANEILALTRTYLNSIVKPSALLKRRLEEISNIDLTEHHIEFANRISELYRGESYYRVHGRTNAELAIMMSEIARAHSTFWGCDLDIYTVGVREFDLQNEPSIKSFIFALVSLCTLARNYSAHRSARLELIFEERGVYFEFGFPIAEEFRKTILSKEAPELINFMRNSEMRFFECICAQDDKAIAIRGFPVHRIPDSGDLKERKQKLIYND